MRIGLGLKLFIALLGAGIVMAAAMGLASRVSFQQGFLGYLNDLEARRLAALSSALGEAYREQGGGPAGDPARAQGVAAPDWAFLAGRDDEWRRILRTSDRAFRSARDSAEASRSARPAESPPEPGGRTSLLDAERRVVAGNRNPAPDAVHQPIVVDGRTVGWVANLPFRELTDAADLTFQRRQSAAAWFIAGLAVLLAGAVAWGLGRTVLAPARQLADATHRLATGHYGTRVPVDSGDALGRLGADFNRLAVTLERNEQRRREFLADVSHELRTPLAIMRGEIEAMEDGLMPFDRRSLQSLQTEVGTLTKLVDDLHTLAIADVGALSHARRPVDLAPLARAAVDGFRDRAMMQGLVASYAGPKDGLTVDADPDRLAQVFANVFENAARYAAGTVERPVPLTVSCRGDQGRIVVDIDDGGPGVADAARPRLFDRFYREEGSRNRATGGSGLGLAICSSIIAAYGGTISAERAPQGGLRVRIALPAVAADAAGADGGRPRAVVRTETT